MKEQVLDLITAYENRLATVAELVTTTYQATVTADGGFGDLDAERERLKTSLQTTLAKNCSFRRKDFNGVMASVLSDSERKRREIEEERHCIVAKIKGYLDEQKKLAISLKQQLVELVPEKATKGLDTVIVNIKTTYQDTGQQLFAMLRDFQSHLETCQREQQEINHRLKRLVDSGESLRIEDLRQLEAATARQDRKDERELRRQEVERLLAHFKQHRADSRPRRQ